MKNLVLTAFIFLTAACSIAQPGQWNTKSKKAIKYVEMGMAATRELSPDGSGPDYKTAIYWVDKAIEKDPLFTDAYFLKAEYCMSIGRNFDAIEAYRKIIEIDPNISTTVLFILILRFWKCPRVYIRMHWIMLKSINQFRVQILNIFHKLT